MEVSIQLYMSHILQYTYNETEGRFRTKLCDKRGYKFSIMKHLNVVTLSAYGVDISQLIRYSRPCGSILD